MNSGQSHAAAGTAGIEALGLPPPLSILTTVAALLGVAINELVLPIMGASAERTTALALDRWGDFATNLTTIAGLIALSWGLVEFTRNHSIVSLQRRLLIASFAGILMPTLVVATVFERDRTNTQIVLFALGAAHVLVVLLCTNAARAGRSALPRSLVLFASGSALFALIAQVLMLMSRQRLEVWQLQMGELARGAGEVAYLATLLVAPLLIWPGLGNARDRAARTAGVTLLGMAVAAFYLASTRLQSDYSVMLYHAQRVDLLVDDIPLAYAFPLSAALSAGLAGALGKDRVRAQAALGLLLLLASGYAPRAPGRLLTYTLAALLLSRAVVALSLRRRPAQGGEVAPAAQAPSGA